MRVSRFPKSGTTVKIIFLFGHLLGKNGLKRPCSKRTEIDVTFSNRICVKFFTGRGYVYEDGINYGIETESNSD